MDGILKAQPDMNDLQVMRKRCIQNMLRLYKNANAGHIGAGLSCIDILVYLYFFRMQKTDRFILSKGHAALAWYVVLAESGKINPDLLDTFYQEGTLLPAHPPVGGTIDGITFGTGSLGHGLSLACGTALSCRYTDKPFDVYCLLSDGDCNAGSTWEAALFAAHHKLQNLYVIIDRNRLQGFGNTEEILTLEPLKKKWESFGFQVAVAENGHNFNSLHAAFGAFDNQSTKPACIIAQTVKGHGVSFMENKMEWHYLPMNEEQYKQALREITES